MQKQKKAHSKQKDPHAMISAMKADGRKRKTLEKAASKIMGRDY